MSSPSIHRFLITVGACCLVFLTNSAVTKAASHREAVTGNNTESSNKTSILLDSFGAPQDSLTVVLLTEIDPEAATVYRALRRVEKGPFLETYWRDRNPLVLKYYYGYHLGRRRYSVSEAFFERGSMIIPRYHTGFPSLETDLVERAARIAERLVDGAPNDAVAHCAVGYLQLEQDRYEEAESHFIRAIQLERRFVEARCGRALSVMGQHHQKQRAFNLFLETIALDPNYAAAHYALCLCHIAMIGSDRVDVDFYVNKLLERFPDHHDAHFKLGAFYEALRYYDRAIASYSNQLTANPAHLRAAERLARVSLLLEAETGKPISFESLRQGILKHPRRYLPMLAEALIRRGEWVEAGDAYKQYLDLIDPVERTLYEDVSLLMTDDEFQELKETRDRLDRKRLIRRFWVLADPTPTTPVNERRIEHYRRIYHIRSNFAPSDSPSNTRPWDRRGEIYLRFGPPDHQSWSDHIMFATDRYVTRVKSRLNDYAHRALHEIAPPASYARGAGFGSFANIDIQGIPTFPLPRGASTINDGSALGYAWESWIYTGVGGGIELTFTDRFRDTFFDYVEAPAGTPFAPLWKEMAPRNVVGRIISKTPSVYHHDFGGEPVDLYVDTAHFRGPGRRTRSEIYTGVPWGAIARAEGDRFTISLQREVALYDDNWHLIHRDSSVVTQTASADDASTKGTLVIGQTNFDLYPGDYFLAVQVREPISGKIQIYRKPFTVDAFRDSGLTLSSLELAGRIAPAAQNVAGPFTKGNLEVIPLPSRAFVAGQPVGLYYEVYNLTRDEFGRTHYQVDYTVKAMSHGFNLINTLGRLLGRSSGKESTRISYDHGGTDRNDAIHISLVSEAGPGPVFLTVSVTDLNTAGHATTTRTIELTLTR